MAPVPTKMGILPLASAITTSRMDWRSGMERREASPVVPRTQRPEVPEAMCSWRRRRREGKSIEPVGVKGVTRATVQPGVMGLISFAFDPNERALLLLTAVCCNGAFTPLLL